MTHSSDDKKVDEAMNHTNNNNDNDEKGVMIVSAEDYLKKRLELLEKEKELTRLRDEITLLRQELPWTKVLDAETYHFQGPTVGGDCTLKDLFGTSSQLIVQHFMFAPDWQIGCKSCCFMTDHFNGAVAHLNAKDVSFVAISRAPLNKLVEFKERMGWSNIPFYSSESCSFNYDMNVAFRKEEFEKNGSIHYNFKDEKSFYEDFPGISVFVLHNDQIYHTYSVFARGLDPFMTTYQFLDIVPKGRNEPKNGHKMGWIKLHDEY